MHLVDRNSPLMPNPSCAQAVTPMGKKNSRTGAHLEGVGNKVARTTAGKAASDDDCVAEKADPSWTPTSPAEDQAHIAEDERYRDEMCKDVIQEGDEPSTSHREGKDPAPFSTELSPEAVKRRKGCEKSARSKTRKQDLQRSATRSNLNMFFSPKQAPKQAPPLVPTAAPVLMSDGSAVVFGVRVDSVGPSTTTLPPQLEPEGPTLSLNGKRLGRPPTANSQGSCTTEEAFASHGGKKAKTIGNVTGSSATRTSLKVKGVGGASPPMRRLQKNGSGHTQGNCRDPSCCQP